MNRASQLDHDTADRLSALSPRVKALEWGPYPNPVFDGPDVAVAPVSILGGHFYQVQRDPHGDGYIAFLAPKFGTLFWESKGHSTIEEAKAAAQADYTRRILSAIEVSASPRVVTDEMVEAGKRLKSIVEEVEGAFKHGGWWDENGVRLKDTPEWVAFYNALTAALSSAGEKEGTFQDRVQPWMMECFGPEISADRIERNHRFLEEALELVQSNGCTQSEAHQLVDYVYGRDQGDINQEVGGVMVTLAALCLANGLNMHEAGETELARIWTKVDQIRAKQAAKPKHSPLPGTTSPHPTSADKLEVVAWQDGEYLTTDQACANGCIPLADHATATRIITEQAERIAKLERFLKASRSGEEQNGVRAEAAEAGLDRMREALKETSNLLADLDQGRSIHNSRFPDQNIDGPLWAQVSRVVGNARSALNGGAEK